MRSVAVAVAAAMMLVTIPGTNDEFWRRLQALCGGAFEGRAVIVPPEDTTFAGKRLVMHVRECTPEQIRIPFHIGDDRSRTWVITRVPGGFRLKHDHRQPDGAPDARTDYGGSTLPNSGTAGTQSFPADVQTSSLVPGAKTNVWTIEIEPGSRIVYALHREGTERRFRIEFDLSKRIPAPPPPWGAR